jgi:hypothetical protein
MFGMLSPQAAGLFLMACGSAFEVLSAMNSSPWTMESFGADERRAAAGMKYTYIGLGMALAIAGGASLLTGTLWPLIACALISVLMLYIYKRALAAGQAAGNRGWHNEPGQPSSSSEPLGYRPEISGAL